MTLARATVMHAGLRSRRSRLENNRALGGKHLAHDTLRALLERQPTSLRVGRVDLRAVGQ